MAWKTKTTLTRAVREKIKKENTKRAKGMKEAREKHSKKGVEKKAEKGGGRKEGVMKKLKKGVHALREIRKYQSDTELI